MWYPAESAESTEPPEESYGAAFRRGCAAGAGWEAAGDGDAGGDWDPPFSEDEDTDPEDNWDLETTPTEAVGISYEEGAEAPKISAIGSGDRARAIVDMAKELGIYIHRDPVLLNELQRLQEGDEVPAELFEAIAIILSFSYILQGKTPENWTRPDGSRAINIKA